MLKVLLYVLIGFVAVVVILLAVIALQSSDLRVSRAARMAAPPAGVFAQVNDFHKWEAWNPWGKLDPQMKQTYDGAPQGQGAVYSWVGNGNVGEGRMTIVDSSPNDRIRIMLEFFKPFQGTNTAEFTFQPEGDQTLVTWTMTGKKNFIAKAMGLVMSMDKMIGDQFDKGLADMKAIVEADPKS